MSKTEVTPMHPMQRATLERYLAFIGTLGGKFHVAFPDGSEWGEPILRGPKRGPRRQWARELDHITRVTAMQVGDVESFELATPEDAKLFQGALAAAANKAFGGGDNYTTEVRGKVASVIREG